LDWHPSRLYIVIRRIVSVSAAFCVLATTAACNSGSAHETTEYAAYDADYRQAKSALKLPPGVEWPAHIKSAAAAGEKVLYEPGSGISEAQFYWLCSWGREWLDQHGRDGRRAADALDHMETARGMRVWTRGVDDALRNMINQAILDAREDKDATMRVLFGGEPCSV
jgi:hypothetical protein